MAMEAEFKKYVVDCHNWANSHNDVIAVARRALIKPKAKAFAQMVLASPFPVFFSEVTRMIDAAAQDKRLFPVGILPEGKSLAMKLLIEEYVAGNFRLVFDPTDVDLSRGKKMRSDLKDLFNFDQGKFPDTMPAKLANILTTVFGWYGGEDSQAIFERLQAGLEILRPKFKKNTNYLDFLLAVFQDAIRVRDEILQKLDRADDPFSEGPFWNRFVSRNFAVVRPGEAELPIYCRQDYNLYMVRYCVLASVLLSMYSKYNQSSWKRAALQLQQGILDSFMKISAFRPGSEVGLCAWLLGTDIMTTYVPSAPVNTLLQWKRVQDRTDPPADVAELPPFQTILT